MQDIVAFGTAIVRRNDDGTLSYVPWREVYAAAQPRSKWMDRGKIIIGWVVVGAFVVLAIATLMGVWEPQK
jgi:hypothetical protein